MIASKPGRDTLSASSTPSTDPGSVHTANTLPDRKSMRFWRAYAIDPEPALKNTTTRLIAVIRAGVDCG